MADGGYQRAYADAVATYLGLGVSRLATSMNSIVYLGSKHGDQATNICSRVKRFRWPGTSLKPIRFQMPAGDVDVGLCNMSKAADRMSRRAQSASVSKRMLHRVLRWLAH